MSELELDFSKLKEICSEEGVRYNLSVQIDGIAWLEKKALIKYLLECGYELDQFMSSLDYAADLGFQGIEFLAYPKVNFEKEGYYYKVGVDFRNVDWDKAVADTLHVRVSSYDKPVYIYTYSFQNFLYSLDRKLWYTDYPLEKEKFFKAAAYDVAHRCPTKVEPEIVLGADKVEYHAYFPILPFHLNLVFDRFKRDRDGMFRLSEFIRVLTSYITGQRMYVDIDDFPDETAELIKLFIDSRDYRIREDWIEPKPVELDERHLEILQSMIDRPEVGSDVIYKNRYKLLDLTTYLAKLQAVFGENVTMDQVEHDICGAIGTAKDMLLMNRIRPDVQHFYHYPNGPREKSERRPGLAFFYNDEWEESKMVAPGVGVDICMKTMFTFNGTPLFLHFAGTRGAVNAFYARLMSNHTSEYHMVNGVTFRMKGLKEHRSEKNTLPAGLLERYLIHHSFDGGQDSMDYMYFMDDGPLPSNFSARVNKIASAPIAEEWLPHVFLMGLKYGLVSPLSDPEQIGPPFLKIKVDRETWDALIVQEVSEGRLQCL